MTKTYDAETGTWTYDDTPHIEPTPEPDPVQRAVKRFEKGEYFYLDGQLCRAKTSIANGAVLTLNTNYQITSIENELAELNA